MLTHPISAFPKRRTLFPLPFLKIIPISDTFSPRPVVYLSFNDKKTKTTDWYFQSICRAIKQ